MEYFAFGETFIEEHKNSHNSPYKFNGKELDEESGLYYYGARYYDSRISIWASVDPLVEKTFSSYGYCNLNPVNLIDPTGMSSEDPPSDKQKALSKIQATRTDCSIGTVWNKINKEDFLNDLTKIVNSPSSVDQGNTNLCGIAAPLIAFAEKKPIEFVDMALEFYQTGRYKGLESNSDLHSTSPSNGLNNAEYVLMTSIKNGLNSFLSYDPRNDSGLSGMTMPKDIDNLMNIFGFQKVANANLKDINRSEYSCILLINWNGFSGGSKDKIKNGSKVNFPTHYILPTSFNVLKNGNYNIEFTHWGSKGNKLQMTPANFNKMAHGLAIYK